MHQVYTFILFASVSAQLFFSVEQLKHTLLCTPRDCTLKLYSNGIMYESLCVFLWMHVSALVLITSYLIV